MGNFIKPLIVVLVHGLLYYLFARLGFFLTNAAGLESPVWIPAGIALAATLKYGPIASVGAFIGNFGSALHHPIESTNLFLPLLFALAAMLQALGAAWLIRRRAGWSALLDSRESIFHLIIWGGFVGCLISATLATTGRLLTQSEFDTTPLQSWATWWFGDLIGVLIFTPILLIWLTRTQTTTGHRTLITLPVLICFVAALLVYHQARDTQYQIINANLAKQTDELKHLIESNLTAVVKQVESLELYFKHSEQVERREFNDYSKNLLLRNPNILATGWAPAISAEERRLFEFQMTSRIKERGEEGGLISAQPRDRYFPLTYVYPVPSNYVLGFDLNSEPTRRKAIAYTEQNWTVAATPPLALVGLNKPAVLLMGTVYKPKLDPLQRPESVLEGLVLIAVDARGIVEAAVGTLSDNSIYSAVWDVDETGNHAPVYEAATPFDPTWETFRQNSTFQFAGRTLQLNIIPTSQYQVDSYTLTPWALLVLCLAFTFLLLSFLLTQTAQTEKIRKVVVDQRLQLISTEKFYQHLFFNLKQVVFQIDENFSWVNLNPAWEQFTHKTIQKSLGQSCLQDIDERDHPALRQILNALLEGRTNRASLEIRLLRSGHPPLWVSLLAQLTEQPLSHNNAHGTIVGSLVDISERKQVEQLQNEFISTVSHELRTPLTSLQGSISLILGGVTGMIPEKSKGMLRIAFNNCERLIRLINDLLDMQKLEAGKMSFQCRPLKLSEALRDTVEHFEPLASQRQLNLVLSGDDQEGWVYADADRLRQVLDNLLSNAMKFAPKYTEILLTLEETEVGWKVSVTDHGPGIPNEFREKIFSKFAQADSSDTRKRGGTGLGLSICQAIIEGHNGEIGYISEPNVETTFYFTLDSYTAPDTQDTTSFSEANSAQG